MTAVATDVLGWVLTNDTANVYRTDVGSPSARLGQISKSAAPTIDWFSYPLALDTEPFLAAEALVVDQNGVDATETPSGNIGLIRERAARRGNTVTGRCYPPPG